MRHFQGLGQPNHSKPCTVHLAELHSAVFFLYASRQADAIVFREDLARLEEGDFPDS